MSLHPHFPASPYAELVPEQRWFPADEALRSTAYEKLLPPLVAKVRNEVFAWRNKGYTGASATSAALLRHWFETDHLTENPDGSLSTFRYYFAQREAVETVIWLYEVRRARDKYDLLRFDASGAVSSGMFPEDWPRYVLKMATGAGKTKVLSLLIAWCFFHKLYEADSTLSRNFLVIAPNIIVLDRLRADFDGLKIFFNDPVLPPNGSAGRDWRDDFQLTLHIQDDVRVVRDTGNFFLTNIHRVFLGEVHDPSLEDDDLRDYFLSPFGAKPAGKTTDSKTDLGEIVREIEELAVFNAMPRPQDHERYGLSEGDYRDLIKLVEQGKTLPEKYRFLLFADKREVELVWNGKTREVCTAILPFQTLEHIDEPRKESGSAGILPAGSGFQPELLDTSGRQTKGWTNKLIWGDNKLILSAKKKEQALARKEQEFRELILRAYRAEPLQGSAGVPPASSSSGQDARAPFTEHFFHGKNGGRLVVVGPINLPVGRLFIEEVITECRKRGASRVDVLAFEFEMGLFPAVLEEAKGKGIDIFGNDTMTLVPVTVG